MKNGLSKYTALNNHGFSLIEVMLAVLVLSIGILAVSKLQGTLIQSGSNANARAVAISLAEKKVDDLRRFKGTDAGGVLWTGTLTSPASIFFEQIADNEGGLIEYGNTQIGNVVYRLSWDATDYVFTSINSPASIITSSEIPDYKMVSVEISWDDPSELARQSITLDTVIDSSDPGIVKTSSSNNFGSESPPLKHTPYAAPDVVPITLKSGEVLRETSKPTPDVSRFGDSTVVGFETITYNVSFDVLRLEDFRTAACQCAEPSGTSEHTYGITTWDSTNNIVVDTIEKVSGEWDSSVDNDGGDPQSVDCYTCCADGFRYSDGLPSGSGGSKRTLSCRMKRVDGLLRVFKPWKMIGFNMIPASYFDDSVNGLAMDTTIQLQNISTYSTHVVSLVRNVLLGYPSSTALDALTTVDTSFAALTSSFVNSGPVTHTNINGLNTIRPLQARAIYMDYPPAGAYEGATYTATNVPLDRILFYEINLSQLAAWVPDEDDVSFDDDYTDNHDSDTDTPTSSNTICTPSSPSSRNCVTNQELVDGGEYSRGDFRSSTPLDSLTTVETKIYTSNDGIVNRRINSNSNNVNYNTSITVPLRITVTP